jgi:hypothetical protein
MKTLSWIAWILVIVGAINWGLYGLLGMNLVFSIFGSMAGVEKLVYILVGISGLWMIFDKTQKPM